jgi:hypothetical protein
MQPAKAEEKAAGNPDAFYKFLNDLSSPFLNVFRK